jgi:hypothetical protein
MAKVNYQQQLAELQRAREEQQAIYEAFADPDSDVAMTVRGRIAELDAAIRDIQEQIQDLEHRREKTRRRRNWDTERPLIDEAMDKNYMGYVIPEDRFIYCRDFGAGQSNVQFKDLGSTRILRLLNKLTGQTIRGRDANEIIDYFEARGRSFHAVTASFNNRRWNESEVYNKMSVIRAHWLEPNYAEAQDYDQRFDILIGAVSGGREENINHLEQWVGFKYLYPGKNANIPNIDMGGNPGGNGKGRFIEMLKTIFTPSCVVQAHREELDKFNAAWEMATILYYDEPEEKELAVGKLKQATGSEDMRIEKKGIDATMSDRNYNFIFLSNNEKGVVKLSGGSDGGEDRRYSVITTDIVLFDVLTQNGMDGPQARSWLDELAQDLVKDRAAVARWLAHIIQKHGIGGMDTLPALHGEDYHRRFDEQKDAVTQAFDAILPVFQSQGVLPKRWLHQMVQTLTENPAHKSKNVAEKFQNYLTRQRQDWHTQERTLIHVDWLGDEEDEIQAAAFVTEATAGSYRTAYRFDYSLISTKKWLKGLGNSNTITSDNIKISLENGENH